MSLLLELLELVLVFRFFLGFPPDWLPEGTRKFPPPPTMVGLLLLLEAMKDGPHGKQNVKFG